MNGAVPVVVILAAIAVWGWVHSWLASLTAKAMAARRFGTTGQRLYRLAYNAFSILTFMPVLALVGLLPDRVLYTAPAPWAFFMVMGQVLAAAVAVVGVVQTGALTFAGVRQAVSPGAAEHGPLVVSGLYRRVRHPLYTAGLAFIWLSPMMTRNLLTLYTALTAYILIGAVFEERKLLKIYGEAYAQYRRQTPMFVPGIHLKSETRL